MQGCSLVKLCSFHTITYVGLHNILESVPDAIRVKNIHGIYILVPYIELFKRIIIYANERHTVWRIYGEELPIYKSPYENMYYIPCNISAGITHVKMEIYVPRCYRSLSALAKGVDSILNALKMNRDAKSAIERYIYVSSYATEVYALVNPAVGQCSEFNLSAQVQQSNYIFRDTICKNTCEFECRYTRTNEPIKNIFIYFRKAGAPSPFGFLYILREVMLRNSIADYIITYDENMCRLNNSLYHKKNLRDGVYSISLPQTRYIDMDCYGEVLLRFLLEPASCAIEYCIILEFY